MADYYNISQLIEICPGSPAQMSLSESGSPWANIPTAPSAGCVHLTRKKIWLLLSRVCYLQHRYFYCNMDCCALQRGGLLSAKSDSWHTPCAGDLADAAAAQLVILLASHVHVCRQQMVGDFVLHGQVEQQLGHAVCEHAQRSLQHVSHCVGQERSGVLHLQNRTAFSTNSLWLPQLASGAFISIIFFASGVSQKAYFFSLNFYRDPAVFPVTAVTPAIRKAKDTQYGAILRHISSIPCDPALAAFLFLRGYRYPAWRRAGCGRGYPLPLPYPHRPRSSGWQRCGAGCGY